MVHRSPLSLFEIPDVMVKPALAVCRTFNTGLDSVFYDVPLLVRELEARGRKIITDAETGLADVAGRLNLGAMANPEGSLLVVNAGRAPFIQSFEDVPDFLAWQKKTGETIDAASVTGVGSSALGSVALAWDISRARNSTVLAIVPGYGVADAILQGLGGWFGFGLHDALGTKSHIQDALALFMPKLAWVGRELVASAPGAAHSTVTGAPVFRRGCGSSDVLHALMKELPIRYLVGHSKGALAIGNALNGLEASRVEGLTVVTLGCSIAQDAGGATYEQYLGWFDVLGWLNSWNHKPSKRVATDHSTNTALPLSMCVERLVT